MNRKKLLIIIVIAILVALFFYFDLGRFFTLASLKAHRAQLAAFYATHRVAMVAGHGSFAVGNSLEEAVSLTTSLEMSARVLLWSRLLKGSMGRARVSRNRPR